MIKIILIVAALIYTISPWDIVPDVFFGLGWLDDAVIWGLVLRYFYVLRKRLKNQFQEYDRTEYQHGSPHTGQNKFGQEDPGPASGKDVEKDPYAVLGVSRNASFEEIKGAYRALAVKYHPDKVQHLGNEFQTLAEKRFKEIQQAYQKLTP